LSTQLSNEQLISSNYKEQIAKLNQTITTLEAELQEAIQSRTVQDTNHSQEIQQYKDEIAKIESEVNDQQELISAYQDQITELENILEQTKIDNKKYQSQAEDFKTRSIILKTELEQMSSHLDQSMSNIEPLNSLVVELERHNDSLGNQYREVNNKLNHRDSELKDSMNRVEELQTNLTQMNFSYKALKKEFDQFQILAQDVESQLVETQADVAELTLLHADSEALLLQKDEQIEILKTEIKRSKTLSGESPKEQDLQSPDFSEANSELSIKVNSLEGTISQYKNQVSILQSSSDQKDQALHNLHLINEGLETERRENLMKHQEQLEELRESVNRYCSELATERDSHQKTQRQYQMIESRLEVMQEERALAQHAGSRKSKFLCF
jgi:chromosome segregation ATPase